MISKVLTEPYVVRDSIVTASASLTNATVTTLIAGDSASKLDLVQIGFSNNSDAATTVTLKDDGTTVRTLSAPVVTASQPEYEWTIPLPQSKVGGNWTVQLPSLSGTTVTVNALFIKR